MLTNTQIKQLLTHWDIDQSLPIQNTYCAGGAMQSKDTWTIGDTFIFKTGKDIAGLRIHLAISKALAKKGMAASYPIITKKGEDFIVEDGRFYSLTHKVSGEFLSPEERYSENRLQIGEKYGEAIGKLHHILKEQDCNLEVNDTSLLDTVINWAMPETKKVMEQWGCPLPDDFYEDYTAHFPSLYTQLPRQIIHRDANPSNIMFEDGKVTGFIDFIIYSIQMIFIAWLVKHEAYKDCALQNRKMLVWIWEHKDKCFYNFF